MYVIFKTQAGVLYQISIFELAVARVYIYVIKHMWILTKLLLRFSRLIQHLY